jgi:hypothetical protein
VIPYNLTTEIFSCVLAASKLTSEAPKNVPFLKLSALREGRNVFFFTGLRGVEIN